MPRRSVEGSSAEDAEVVRGTYDAVSSRPVSPRNANSTRETMSRRCFGVARPRERLAQDRDVAAMGLELEELEAREHQVGVGVRWKGGEEVHRSTGEDLRLAAALCGGSCRDGDGDRGIPVVRGNRYLFLRGALTRRPTTSSEQEGGQKPCC